jgi:CRISPR-associated protein (TIGR03984 family)
LHLSCDQGPLARNELTLDPQRLQQLRLFGANAELYLWRGPQAQPSAMAELQARIFRDQRAPQRDPSSTAPDNEYAYMDEAYLLWGWGDEVKDGFVTLVEGTQGIVHSPPLAAPVNEGRRAALTVRHYLQPDAEGLVQVVGSRLVGLK